MFLNFQQTSVIFSFSVPLISVSFVLLRCSRLFSLPLRVSFVFPVRPRFHCSRDFHGSKATDSQRDGLPSFARQTSAAFKQTRPTEAAQSTAAGTPMVSRQFPSLLQKYPAKTAVSFALGARVQVGLEWPAKFRNSNLFSSIFHSAFSTRIFA